MTDILNFDTHATVLKCSDSIDDMYESDLSDKIIVIGELDKRKCNDNGLKNFVRIQRLLTAFVVDDDSDAHYGIESLIVNNESGIFELVVSDSFVLAERTDKQAFSMLFEYADSISFSSRLGTAILTFNVKNLYRNED